ncbi:uncharacterized protein A4U43_C02F15630 [Asparagus officinalis]|uniref:DUF4218 domain-containing protein n=1 Tax=Asparagus officinalis TaxID=4686 RepID=A0A5P1FII4_ASPOF|nr:uncharacterized protein A4U43_C02F15630 [Asparagus officinalis]
MKVLKGNVRNRYRPESCIAETYLVEEAIEYWSEYIPNVEAIGLPHTRHTDRIDGEGVTGGQPMLINLEQWRRVHLCVLHNTVDVVPYVELHKQGLAKDHPDKDSDWIEVEHNSTFIDWMTTKSKSKGRARRDGQDGGNGQGGSKETQWSAFLLLSEFRGLSSFDVPVYAGMI